MASLSGIDVSVPFRHFSFPRGVSGRQSGGSLQHQSEVLPVRLPERRAFRSGGGDSRSEERCGPSASKPGLQLISRTFLS